MVPINALYFYEKQLEEDYDYSDEELEQAEIENQANHDIKAYYEDLD